MQKKINFKQSLLGYVILVILITGSWQIITNTFVMVELVTLTILGAAAYVASYFFASPRLQPVSRKLVFTQVIPVSLVLLFLMSFMAGIVG